MPRRLAAGSCSVSSSASPEASSGRPRMVSAAIAARRCTIRWRAAGSASAAATVDSFRSSATSRAESSTRVHAPLSSVASSRPPTAKAATPRITPLSISASLVVPPPMSTCSTHSPRAFDSATAPEPCAASRLSSLCPAVAQTNLPASSANNSSMARAFLRLIASPVRMTAPLSISLRAKPASR